MLNGGITHIVLDALAVEIARGVERVADTFIDRNMPGRAEEPELVSFDRAAHVEVEVLDVVDEVPEFESSISQIISQVVRLPARGGASEESATLDRIAAVFGN